MQTTFARGLQAAKMQKNSGLLAHTHSSASALHP